MKIISALFENRDDAHAAARALEDSGLNSENIDYVSRVTAKEHATGSGAAIGVTGGVLAGLAFLAIPGIGPVAAAGTLGTALAGGAAGGAAGGVIGHFSNLGIEESDAHIYAEGIRRGGAVLVVEATDPQVEIVDSILKSGGAADVEERRNIYGGEGWNGFSEAAGALVDSDLDNSGKRKTTDEAAPVPPVR